MALYAYIKRKNRQSVISRLSSPLKAKTKIPRKVLFLFSTTFLLSGLFLIGQVVYPIIGWYFFVLPGYNSGIVSPLASNFRPENSPIYPTLVQAQESLNPNNRNDSYRISTWFIGAKANNPNSKLKVYTLTIPKLKIESATVQIGGEDLKKSLIAWPTSSPPGNFGNNIIFGHSELPQLANPKSYNGIFTFLMDLEVNDEIFVDYDGVRYKYSVTDKIIISPTDLSVLEQRFDDAHITLITCVPPGTVWKRGVVKGKLAQI